MQWENCPKCAKCPSFLISEQIFNSGVIFTGNNFEICLPCLNGRKNKDKFFIWGTGPQIHAFFDTETDFETLIECVQELLNWSDLQLEDHLKLLRIKNELG